MNAFAEVKKNFGFGFMRLPMKDGEINHEELCRMVDAFLEAGFNYFDTAHGYHDGKSELALKACLTSRYPREKYLVTNKLTDSYFQTEEDIRPFFEKQLEWVGVEYFDFYLMHAQNKGNYEKFKRCHAYETAFALKAEGKIRHVGLSFHDRAVVLDQILTDYPEVEVVQIQYNYVDYNDSAVESRKCLEVCEKHGKPVIVMEPVKGGSLVNLPPTAQLVLDELNKTNPNACSNAGYAIRFAASPEQMFMVLSGMSNLAQMEDNIASMKDFVPCTEEEYAAIDRVCEVFKAQNLIPCTACRYCVAGCPMNIPIPDLFACMNAKNAFHDWNSGMYSDLCTAGYGKASDCIKCGKCERICPQHLEIRDLLGTVAKEME